nr:60S ribosomal protein L31 [Cryptomonas sp.]
MDFSNATNIECTLNLHKRLYGLKFKNRASRAIFEIRNFAKSLLGIDQIRIDSTLNKEIWKSGPRHVPFRVRVRISKHKYLAKKDIDNQFIFVSLAKNNSFKHMKTKNC